jgi:hypothetical protein
METVLSKLNFGQLPARVEEVYSESFTLNVFVVAFAVTVLVNLVYTTFIAYNDRLLGYTCKECLAKKPWQ